MRDQYHELWFIHGVAQMASHPDRRYKSCLVTIAIVHCPYHPHGVAWLECFFIRLVHEIVA